MSEQSSERRSTYVNLASQELGATVVYANDDFFASKDNLILPTEPVWKEDAYTDRGKWMDGWESRRRRIEGNDYCFIKLGLPGVIREVVVDTAFFRGNYPDACSLEGCVLHPNATTEDLEHATWFSLVPSMKLEGNTKHWFDVNLARRVTHVRFQIYPDGGVARLRLHGEALPDLDRWRAMGLIDLASMAHGGRTLGQSDMFFGVASNLLKPNRGKNMGDGWETMRSRGRLETNGFDWCLVQLAAPGEIRVVEIDTHHFKGNFPDRFELLATSDALDEDSDPSDILAANWSTVIDETKLQAHTLHTFDELGDHANVKFALLKIFPDGGVSRLRLWGAPSTDGWKVVGVRELNTIVDAVAEQSFASCCGSTTWTQAMLSSRPFGSFEELLEKADEAFDVLTDEDWIEAFEAHPKIGESKAQKNVTRTSARWSAGEQRATADASQDTMARLADGNARYLEKFGFIFIIFATGKSAFEILKNLEKRIENDAETELENAAREQRKITNRRLEKLVTGV